MAYCISCGRTVADDETHCRTCDAPRPTAADLDQEDRPNPMQAPGMPPPSPAARRVGPSRSLMVVAAAALAAVVVLSVLLAKRHGNTVQPTYNATQLALSSALQAAGQVYDSNRRTFPSGQSLITQLQRTDPGLLFAFGPQGGSSPSSASAPLSATGISVGVSQDGEVIMFAAKASDGTCWYATDNHETRSVTGGLDGASQSRGTSYASASGQTSCTGGAGMPPDATPWTANWPSS